MDKVTTSITRWENCKIHLYASDVGRLKLLYLTYNYLVVVVVFSPQSTAVQSCYECSNIADPSQCTRVVTCRANEVSNP